MKGLARAHWLAQLLLLLALAVRTGHGQPRQQPPEPPSQDANLSPLELLELGAPAVRYLRAFTTQCWQPDRSAPIAMFDNSWAVALVTIWNDLTVPSNGLGRLVTAMQLQAEGALMMDDKRAADALSVLELSVLFSVYPVHHDMRALAAWHRSLASPDAAFAARRLVLARTLGLISRAQAAVGATAGSVDALEAAMESGRAAAELHALDEGSAREAGAPGGANCSHPQPSQCGAEHEAAGPEELQQHLAGVARTTAAMLRDAGRTELERLLDRRGLQCRGNCGKRSSLLKLLVPALRVPLRLVPVNGEAAASVEAPAAPELAAALAPRGPRGGAGPVAHLGALLAAVVATLQQPLLADVGILCSSPAGVQQVSRCREQAEAQFGGWADGAAEPDPDMHALLARVAQVEEALWRLDEVLEGAMSGVRLGDGTTWVKHSGYAWGLGSYMAAKLYPGGQGAPLYYQQRRPSEAHAGSTICLDRTYLLDTVLRLDADSLGGLQYALDNLHFAQFHAGGTAPFWRLLALDNPLCTGAGCQTGREPTTLVVEIEVERLPPLPRAPRPLSADLRFLGEQQLQANLAAATDPSYRGRDPFFAAFISLCVVSCASLYLYSRRERLVRALTPQRGRGTASAAGASAAAQRSAATAALRDALSGDSAGRLLAALEAAEGHGVEKPLIKKARAVLQALKKRRAAGGAAAGAPASHRTQPSQRGAPPASLQRLGSGASSASSSSLGGSSLPLSLSERTAALYAAAAAASRDSWSQDRASEAGSSTQEGAAAAQQQQQQQHDGSSAGGSSAGGSSACSPIRPRSSGSGTAGAPLEPLASATPPKTSALAPLASFEPEQPTSPGTPMESGPRSSPGEGGSGDLSSDACSPLLSPHAGAAAAAAGSADALSPRSRAPASAAAGASPALKPTITPTLTPTAGAPQAAEASDSGSAGTPRGSAADLEAAAAARQMTPHQLKKLLRLQQKHAATATAPLAPASDDADAAAASTAAAPSAAHRAGRTDSAKERGGASAAEEASARELAALAAREESAPSRQPRSAKKKGKKAPPSPSSSSDAVGTYERSSSAREERPLPRGRGERGGRDVRRTLSDPQHSFGGTTVVLSPLRSRQEDLHLDLLRDPRLRAMAGFPAPTYWQQMGLLGLGGQPQSLNAHAPEFSPSPSRPPPGMGSPRDAHQPGLQLHGNPFGSARGPRSHNLGLPYSPDSSLVHLAASSGHSSLDPGSSGASSGALLAQLQQIWGGGEGGAGGAALPGFGVGLGSSPAMLSGTEQQQQQQLAALLFMQQLEAQQAALAGRGGAGHAGYGGPDSVPVSPQQLPPASADMLREVLGSPLASLPRAAWPGSGSLEGGLGSPTAAMPDSPGSMLSAVPRGVGDASRRSVGQPAAEVCNAYAPVARGHPPAARSLAGAAHGAAGRRSADLARHGGGGEARRIDSFDLEALGFTEAQLTFTDSSE